MTILIMDIRKMTVFILVDREVKPYELRVSRNDIFCYIEKRQVGRRELYQQAKWKRNSIKVTLFESLDLAIYLPLQSTIGLP